MLTIVYTLLEPRLRLAEWNATLAHQHSATIAIAHPIIWSMLSSSSLPTVPLLHSRHPSLLLTEKTGLSGV